MPLWQKWYNFFGTFRQNIYYKKVVIQYGILKFIIYFEIGINTFYWRSFNFHIIFSSSSINAYASRNLNMPFIISSNIRKICKKNHYFICTVSEIFNFHYFIVRTYLFFLFRFFRNFSIFRNPFSKFSKFNTNSHSMRTWCSGCQISFKLLFVCSPLHLIQNAKMTWKLIFLLWKNVGFCAFVGFWSRP